MRWLKFLAVLFLAVAIAYSEAGKRRRRRRKSSTTTQSDDGTSSPTSAPTLPNNPACYEIKDSWWSLRKNAIDQLAEVTEWDTVCAIFDGNPDACHYRESPARYEYYLAGNITEEQYLNTPCNYLSAGSNRCIGSPCAQLNNGECTIQATYGLCNWFTQEDADTYGVEYGCRRNPCHIEGAGGAVSDDTCESRGIPGLLECTNCRGGVIDPELKGLKMGCQRVNVTTTAGCESINSGVRALSSIYQQVKKKKCQCSVESPLCSSMVFQKGGTAYKQRF